MSLSQFDISLLKTVMDEIDIGVDPTGDDEKLMILRKLDNDSLKSIRESIICDSALPIVILSGIAVMCFFTPEIVTKLIGLVFLVSGAFCVLYTMKKLESRTELKKRIMEIRRDEIIEEKYQHLIAKQAV
jgi:hypothetical protein